MKDYFRNSIAEKIDDGGRVEVEGHSWQNSAVFENMDPIAFESHIDGEYAQLIHDAKSRAKTFLNATGSLENFQLLIERVKANSVLPFVGAGLSITSGFPLWGDFLLRLADDDEDLKQTVKQQLDTGQYEEAAQEIVEKIGQDAFSNDIHAHLGNLRGGPAGPVKLLPHCFKNGCITTNLDEVLERVYRSENLAFTSAPFGEQLKNLQGFINPEHNILFKLHGTAVQSHGRILTRLEYQRAYGNDIALSGLLTRLTGNKHILFLGCSLNSDRTLEALVEINRDAGVNTPPHCAFLPLTADTDRAARRQQLGAANIHPIWYPHAHGEDHDQPIEDLLVCLIEGSVDD